MYNNYFDVGRHMGGWNGGWGAGLGNGINTWSLSPAAFIGLSIISGIFIIWFIVSIILKGYALWTAAKRNEKWWFIALLVINTMGILELVYLIFFAKVSFGQKKNERVEHDGHNSHHNHHAADSEEKMSTENEEHTKNEAAE